MDNQVHSASYDKKIAYMLAVLETEEKQRQRIENKSTVLAASNAILLTAIIWLGLPLANSATPIQWLQSALTIVSLSAAIMSVLFTVHTITRVTPEQRGKIMDLIPDSKHEYNLFFFSKVALYSKVDYQHQIDSLTEQEILRQLVSEAHNLSRLLRHRYRTMDFATAAFTIGIIAFAFVALTKLLVR